MNDLQTFFSRLAVWEGLPAVPLVARWNLEEAREIGSTFRRAFDRCRFGANPLIARWAVSSQSVRNLMATFISTEIDRRLEGFRIEPCPGRGYPDNRLVRVDDKKAYALEFKTSQGFDPTDDNRMVLTCRSEKLRRCFKPPIRHLLATVCHERIGRKIWIRWVYLDFLEPTMPVHIRLESSVTKRLLATRSGISDMICCVT